MLRQSMLFFFVFLSYVAAQPDRWNRGGFGSDQNFVGSNNPFFPNQGFDRGRNDFGRFPQSRDQPPPPRGPLPRGPPPMIISPPFGMMGDIRNPNGIPPPFYPRLNPFGIPLPRGPPIPTRIPPPLALRKYHRRLRFRFDEAMQLNSKPKDWNRRAKRFCRRFPGHPSCRGGKGPEFSEFSTIITTVFKDIGNYLPRVPRISIRNPLSNINTDLVSAANSFHPIYGYEGDVATNHIRNACRSFKCRDQSQQQEELRETIVTKISNFEKTVSGKDNIDVITLRFDRTQQIKQALLEKANLTDVVVAADNGIFDRDLLLTEKQQTFLLNELGKAGVGTDEIPEPGSDDDDEFEDGVAKPLPNDTSNAARLRRASIFFEENIVQKWDLSKPIPYSMDDSLEELDREDVRQALNEISKNTCIKFQYFPDAPSGYHINYLRIDSPTFCGLSYMGRTDPANPIYLSFQCGDSRGVAVHETMHALGVNHQHLRMDRDQHITVDWSNINPQMYDSFVVADSKLYTTYGIKYDYGSIMHYNAYTAAINVTKPTMIPKVKPEVNLKLLGQRSRMSQSDINILNKMYCKPDTCNDKNVYCGAWALKDLCNNPNNKGWMINNCRKSCNFC